MTRRCDGGRGQSLVELALLLPVFLLIIFGLIDGGRLVYAYNTVSNAARQAARVAIVNQSTSGTNTCDTSAATAWPTGCAIQSGILLNLDVTDIVVEYRDSTDSGPCPALSIGCIAVVTVSAEFQPFTPLAGPLLGTLSVSSTSKMPVERVCSNPTPAPIPHC